LLVGAADVYAVVEFQIDSRNRNEVFNDFRKESLLILDGVPVFFLACDRGMVTGDLDQAEWELRIAQILAEGGYESFHPIGIQWGIVFIGVGATLIPDNAGNAGAVFMETAKGGAIEAFSIELFLFRVPIGHGSSAVGTGDKPLRYAGKVEHGLSESDARSDADGFVSYTGSAAVEIGMHGIDGGSEIMDGVFSDSPAVIHVKCANHGVWRSCFFQQADTFHVGLTGENPDIADQNIVCDESFAGVEGECEFIRPTDGDAGQFDLKCAGVYAAQNLVFEAWNGFSVSSNADLQYAACIAGTGNEGFRDIITISLKDLMISKAGDDLHFFSPST